MFKRLSAGLTVFFMSKLTEFLTFEYDNAYDLPVKKKYSEPKSNIEVVPSANVDVFTFCFNKISYL